MNSTALSPKRGEWIDPSVGTFVVNVAIEEVAQRRGPRLEHDDAPADCQNAGGLFEELRRSRDVVKDVSHHDVADGLVFERQVASVDHEVDPRRRFDVRGDGLGCEFLEETGPRAEFDDGAVGAALLEDGPKVRLVDAA